MAFQAVNPRVWGKHNGGQNRLARGDRLLDGPAESPGKQLHLADFVDDYELSLPHRLLQGINPGRLEGFKVDPVLAYPLGAGQVDVGEAARRPSRVTTSNPTRRPPARSSRV